jgi:hypothetical protein
MSVPPTAPWTFKTASLPETLTAADALAKRDAARGICDPDGAWHTWCLVHLPEHDRKSIYTQFTVAYLAAQILAS